MRRDVEVTDGLGSRSDASRGHRNVSVIRNGTNTTAEVKETISTGRNAPKTRELPVGAGRRDQVKARSHAGTLNTGIDDMAMKYSQKWLEARRDTTVYAK